MFITSAFTLSIIPTEHAKWYFARLGWWYRSVRVAGVVNGSIFYMCLWWMVFNAWGHNQLWWTGTLSIARSRHRSRNQIHMRESCHCLWIAREIYPGHESYCYFPYRMALLLGSDQIRLWHCDTYKYIIVGRPRSQKGSFFIFEGMFCSKLLPMLNCFTMMNSSR